MTCENGTVSCLYGFCNPEGQCICDEGYEHDYSWINIKNCGVHQASARWAMIIGSIVAVFQLLRLALTRNRFRKLKGTARHLLYSSGGFAVSTLCMTVPLLASDLRYSWFLTVAAAVYSTIGYYSMTCVVRISLIAVALNSDKELRHEKRLHRALIMICRANFVFTAFVATIARELIDAYLDETYHFWWFAGIFFFNNIVQFIMLYNSTKGLATMEQGLRSGISDMNKSEATRRLQDLLERVVGTKKQSIALCSSNAVIFFFGGITLIITEGNIPYSFWVLYFAIIANPLLSSLGCYYFIDAKRFGQVAPVPQTNSSKMRHSGVVHPSSNQKGDLNLEENQTQASSLATMSNDEISNIGSTAQP